MMEWLRRRLASLGLKKETVSDGEALSILLVDDTPENLEVLVGALRPLGHKLLIAKNGTSALEVARRKAPALVLLDIMMPDMDGYEVCRRLKADPDTENLAIVFCSALHETSARVQGLELGAVDFITKPFDPEEVVARVTTHLAVQQLAASLRTQNQALLHELAIARDSQGEATRRLAWMLLGDSPAVQELHAEIGRYSQSADSVVVLQGPPSCGEEAVARALHVAGRPFIAVDCSALSEATLFEDQPDAPAKLTLAQGGSLYLENAHELSRAAHDRLHRWSAAHPQDVRLLLHFGQDSGARPGQVRLPTLAERRTDLGLLAGAILERHARRLGKPTPSLEESSLRRLEEYPWPGNLRELEDVLLRSLMTSSDEQLRVDASLLTGGTALGSYRLLEKLGEGGMGEVWSARHYLLSRSAAVKLIRAAEASNQVSAERFRREATAIARLTSPHTVTLYDFGVGEKGGFYYVMELLEGEDLEVMLRRSGPLEPERLAYYLVGACKSLAEAHAAGLVHRDLKPSNLFSCRLGLENDFLKVLDFGLARQAEGVESRLTQEHTVHGTPDYMAPESLTEVNLVDGRSDIYSLAATAYHLLVGQPLFTGTSMQRLMKHASGKVPALPAHVPDSLARLVMDCLGKTPAERPTAVDMLARLTATGLPQRWTPA